MKNRSLILLLTIVMAMSATLSGCTDNKNAEEDKDVVIEEEPIAASPLCVAIGVEPSSVDPAFYKGVESSMLYNHALEGLTRLASDGETYEAGQAERWDISEDGLTYTFYLREGLKWSDGSDLVAEDFVYSWNRAINIESDEYAYLYEVIEGYDEKALKVVAQDDKTLVVTLKHPTPYFLEICAFPTYFPVKKEAVEASLEEWSVTPSLYVGNGPYKLKEWEKGSYIMYEQNENYWDAASLLPEQIKFMVISDPEEQLDAYEANEVSFIEDFTVEQISEQITDKDFHVEEQIGTYFVSYNTQNEYLGDPLIRKALTLAIDRTYICEQISRAGEQSAGAFVSTGLSDTNPTKEFREIGGNYFDPQDYEYNVEMAKAALEEAGYPDGEGLPTFVYLTNDAEKHVVIAEALQNMWANIGINISVETQEENVFLQSRINGEYDMARNGWTADYGDPMSFLEVWTTSGSNNNALWSNLEYDALIETSKTTKDLSLRMKEMHKAEDILFREWVLCPIYYYVDTFKLNEKVQGFYSSKLGFKFFKNATIIE